MAFRSSSRDITDPFGSVILGQQVSVSWDVSPRVNGKLALRANPLTYSNAKITGIVGTSAPNGNHYTSIALGDQHNPNFIPGWSWDPLEQQALAKFNGRLRHGSASMGVTLASWKQSRDMIVNRSNRLGRSLDKAYMRLSRDKRLLGRLRNEREPLANQILETEFGWRPLFQDMHAALYTVCQDGIPNEYIRSVAKGTISVETGPPNVFPNAPKGYQRWKGDARVVLSAKVVLSNPNLWLLNRLGLINPATVIWDLVPWSFVVNMFVNVNAMISSVTNEIGLEISDKSTTRSSFVTKDEGRISNGDRGTLFQSYQGKFKTRSTGTLPALQWQVRIPKLNWELALIASALVVQKFKKINNLLRIV